MTAEDLSLFSVSILNLFSSLQILKLQSNCQKGFLAEIPTPGNIQMTCIHIIMQQANKNPLQEELN